VRHGGRRKGNKTYALRRFHCKIYALRRFHCQIYALRRFHCEIYALRRFQHEIYALRRFHSQIYALRRFHCKIYALRRFSSQIYALHCTRAFPPTPQRGGETEPVDNKNRHRAPSSTLGGGGFDGCFTRMALGRIGESNDWIEPASSPRAAQTTEASSSQNQGNVTRSLLHPTTRHDVTRADAAMNMYG
jgi:hypothetical protein